jgi:lipoic acid synthetase
VEDEPYQVAEAVATLGLDYVVITSVTRDDLADGGALIFSETIAAIRKVRSGAKVEALIPDFGGDERALDLVLEARPDILNHNLETPERYYPEIHRPLANYRRSLGVLERAHLKGAVTKSGIMIGLGEAIEDILHTFDDLRSTGCDLLTIGQYLQPSKDLAPVRKYYAPGEFKEFRTIALGIGFKEIESGPLVRSSFHALGLYKASQKMV